MDINNFVDELVDKIIKYNSINSHCNCGVQFLENHCQSCGSRLCYTCKKIYNVVFNIINEDDPINRYGLRQEFYCKKCYEGIEDWKKDNSKILKHLAEK